MVCGWLKKHSDEMKWLYGYIRLFSGRIFLIVFIEVMLSMFGVSFALVSRKLIDLATGFSEGSLLFYGILMGILMLFEIFLQSGLLVYNARVSEDMTNTIRIRILSLLAESKWLGYSKLHSGDVVTRMTSDVLVVTGGIMGTAPGIISLFVRLIAAFILLFHFDPVLAFLGVLIGPLFLLLSKLFSPTLRKLHLETQHAESNVRRVIQEILGNILVVKAFNLEESSLNQVCDLQNVHRTWIVKRSFFGMGASAVMSFGFGAGYLLALIWGAYRLTKGMITFGTLTAFLQLIGQIQGPFLGLAHSLPRVISTCASATRLMDLEVLPKEERGVEEHLDNKSTWGISIDDLSYSYEKEQVVLDGLNLRIEPGETLAIMGPSGEGKTTLLRMLLALVLPDSGQISLFNELGEKIFISRNTRRLFSYVPQGNTLFSGTVMENLKAGSAEATSEEVQQALKMSCALDFVNELPKKEETLIGENGEGLSEGQLQRLSIARALLRRAPILILDEATSSLDEFTEKTILTAIKNDSFNRTCIFVSHRPSVKDYCDRYYYMTK